MPLEMKPRVVVTIHGIQTHGKWQKKITPYLAGCGLVPYHIDYGRFGLLKFLSPFSRESQLSNFRKELLELMDRVGTRRVSVIAHSFGTYLAMEALKRENGNLTYDRVVLTGSIVPLDFDWRDAVDKRWVMAVRNERATSDWVVGLAALAARLPWIFRLKAGDSGRQSFNQKLPELLDDFVVGNHSDTHNPLKFEQWARFISYPHLPKDILDKVTTEMSAFRVETAKIFGLSPRNIRVNMFAPIGGALRIVPGACVNMTYAPELDLEIKLGHGATGTAFETGNACGVIKQGRNWSGSSLPKTELDKVNPSLRWVISIPIISQTRGITVAVVNIDGLFHVPAILQDNIQAALLAVTGGFAPRIEKFLDAAFRGDPAQQLEA